MLLCVSCVVLLVYTSLPWSLLSFLRYLSGWLAAGWSHESVVRWPLPHVWRLAGYQSGCLKSQEVREETPFVDVMSHCKGVHAKVKRICGHFHNLSWHQNLIYLQLSPSSKDGKSTLLCIQPKTLQSSLTTCKIQTTSKSCRLYL